MFDKEYSFKGKHAQIVKQLTQKFDGTNSIFSRNLDVYLLAPIVGILNSRTAEQDDSRDENGEIITTKIFTDQLTRVREELLFNYKLVVLLHNKETVSFKERMDSAFRYYNDEDPNSETNILKYIDIYESYVRGGIEILDEKLLENGSDYIENLYDFVKEFDALHNAKYNDLTKLVIDYEE